MEDDEAWLRRLLEGGQRALAKARQTDAHELRLLIEDLQSFCDDVERRLRNLVDKSDDAPAPTGPEPPPNNP